MYLYYFLEIAVKITISLTILPCGKFKIFMEWEMSWNFTNTGFLS